MHRGGRSLTAGGAVVIDFNALFSQLFATYWWLPPVFIVAALFKSAWFKGFIGEVMVNMAARFFLNKHDYHLTKGQARHLLAHDC